MKQQIYKMSLTEASAGYEIPEGWELDKLLDVQANYVIMVLNKIVTAAEAQAEYNARYGVAPTQAYNTEPGGYGYATTTATNNYGTFGTLTTNTAPTRVR